jgi:hypothetical protein
MPLEENVQALMELIEVNIQALTELNPKTLLLS